jgi:tRNA threonylcarbamoyl adenosine modification protein (Sua5/YciO/YrdC/YwlC family)
VTYFKLMAELIKIFIDTPHLRVIKKAVECIKNGGIIVYPTDTIYGLAADLHNKKAMEKIQRIKGSKTKLLSFILPDLKDISRYANVPDYAYKSMRRVTPGPYTFVLNATKEVPRLLLFNRKTVGIRIPDAPFALKLLEELGNPLLSTSVPYGESGYHTDPYEIQQKYDNEIDLILDAGVMFNNPSTIVDFTGDDVKILREGAGDVRALNY